MTSKLQYILFCILPSILCIYFLGCTHADIDERLKDINASMAEAPEEALQRLDTMDIRNLSEADLHLYDLLCIKAKDKTYIHHSSDSVISKIIDYYSTHKDTPYYSEALYYGGRVYSDLGDWPTALAYFHQALETMPDNTWDTDLRSTILSQTGRLLSNLRLYDEAIPYLEESGKLIQPTDSLDLFFHYRLLGETYMYKGDYLCASESFKKASDFGRNLDDGDIAGIQLSKANLLYYEEKIDEALATVRGLPDRVPPVSRNLALAVAADIYKAAGCKDTAYMYGLQLIESGYPDSKKTGYRLILSPDLQKLSPLDSLTRYFQAYKELLEEEFDENERDLTLMQQSQYNYQLHKREKEMYASAIEKIRLWLICAVAVILLLMLAVLLLMLRHKQQQLRLWQEIEMVRQLKERLSDSGEQKMSLLTPETTSKKLRGRLQSELLDLAENGCAKVEESLLQSAVYARLQTLISKNTPIGDKSELWEEIELVVLRVSPNFKVHLNILTEGKLKPSDYSMALLMKCGMTPSEVSKLLSKALSTISTRRDALSRKIFDEKMPPKVLDAVIIAL